MQPTMPDGASEDPAAATMPLIAVAGGAITLIAVSANTTGAIAGGAAIPPLAGMLADHLTLRVALLVPALCHLIIAVFGLYARPAPARAR